MEENKKLFDFYSKRELAQNFSLDELLNFARQGILSEWFSENFYAGEARKLTAAINEKSGDAELKLLLCKVFDLPLENLSASELEEVSSAVEKKQLGEMFMKRLPDDKKAAFVKTQGELVKALKDEAQIIYLYGGEFKIPFNRRGVTYIGCENAVIDVDEESDLDLDACEIVLENLQVYLHHPIALKTSASKNLKILNGTKKILGERPTLKEIFRILRGRRSFEPPENFKTRAQEACGAAVGTVLLEDKNYNFETAQFSFRPQWDFEYISVLKDFAVGKNFSLKLMPNDAEKLYINERKLQIFADFTYRDGKLRIQNLYFDTKTLGRIDINPALHEENITSASSGFGLGYGLDIITDIQPSIPNKTIKATTFIQHREGDKLASILSQKARSFKSEIQIKAKGSIINAKSSVRMNSIGFVKGDEVTIIAEGSDAIEAVDALIALIDFAGW